MNFKFWQKNNQPDSKQNAVVSNYQADDKDILKDIEFYAMPRKFTVASENKIKDTKKWGIIIIVVDALLLIISVSLLIWYIFKSPATVNNVAQNNNFTNSNDQSQTEQIETEQALTFEKKVEDQQAESRDFSDKLCGETDLFTTLQDDFYATNSVLSCVGERVQNGCLRASAIINNNNINGLRLSVLGLRQDECLVQLTYPSEENIKAEELRYYANSYLRCAFKQNALSALNYEPARLAAYLYEENNVDKLTETSPCEGVAFTLWHDRNIEPVLPVSSFTLGLDTDQDGLSDIEENTVFTTSINNSDTDKDDYSDSIEILNLYNPIGVGLLKDSGLVEVFHNATYDYNLFYPKDWRVEDEASGNNIMFFSNLNSFVQVITQANSQKQTLALWYADMNNLANTFDLSTIKTAGDMEVLYSPDGLTAYIVNPTDLENIYVFTYSPGQNKKLDFASTFKMMINSLSVNRD